ncbi:MAG: LysM peptidoglycan-binding domain-containing protein [Bacillota bacterium]|nr:LysM peptidoglycan-binding domain-containing protein [Bacillota bacterium]
MIIILKSTHLKKNLKINLFRFIFSIAIISFAVFGTVSVLDNHNTAMSAYEHCDTVTVSSGETLWNIASMYNDGSYDTRIIVNDIIAHNDLSSSDLYAGQTIEIPGNYSLVN